MLSREELFVIEELRRVVEVQEKTVKTCANLLVASEHIIAQLRSESSITQVESR